MHYNLKNTYMQIKEINGFEGLYKITDTGIVIANDRIVKMPKGGEKIIKEHNPKLSITKKGYAKVMLTNKQGIRKGFFVHRLVIENFTNKSKLQVNHKDCNKLNNNIENLEFVTNRENSNHRLSFTNKSSKFAGVTWNKKRNKWQSQKMINGKKTYLGLFDNENDAYNKYLQS